MATIITKYIGPGMDYTSIHAWDLAAPANLITADQVWIGIIAADLNENVTISARTTDSTHYRKLTVEDSNYHYGVKTQGIRLAGKITINEKYFVLEKLRITQLDPYYAPSDNDLYVIDCPGSGVSRYITIDKCLIHDCMTVGDDLYLFGIRMSSNGGGVITNCIITDLYKDNTEADAGGLAGIYIDGAVIANYVLNNTIINLSTYAQFMFADGGIGVWDNKTIVQNNICMLRQYTDDASSIPNVMLGHIDSPEDYRMDFVQYAGATSGYNCEMGSPFGQYQYHLPGDQPRHSLTGIDPYSVFRFPGQSPLTGNSSYGYGFKARGTDFYGLLDHPFVYKVEPHETGNITFNNVTVKQMIAGWLYDGYGPDGYGPLTELNEDGSPYTTSHYLAKYSGTFFYDRDHRIFNQISGDTELANIFELTESGIIQYVTSYVTTDWSINPPIPTGGPYSRDSYGFIAGYTVGPSNLILGAIRGNSMQFEITNRVLNGVLDLRLKNGSPCNGTGTPLLSFPTLEQDIALVTRSNWDMGAFAYIPYVTCRGWVGTDGWHVGEASPQISITDAQVSFDIENSFWTFSIEGVACAYFDPLAPQYYRYLNTVPTGTRQKATEASIRFDNANKAIKFYYNNEPVGVIDENGLN